MRILLLNDDALPEARGGAAVIVDNLRRAYASRGQEVALIAADRRASAQGASQERDDAGLIVRYRVASPLRAQHRLSIGKSPVAHELKKFLDTWKPDVVHAHNVHISLGYDTLRIAHESGCRVFLTAHDTFLVSFARIASERYRKSVLSHSAFRMHFWEHIAAVGRGYWPLRNTAIRAIIGRNIHRVIALSTATERLLHDHGITNTVRIPNGLATEATGDAQAFRGRFGIKGPIILLAGRLGIDKGAGALIAAIPAVLREVPDCTFVFAGERERMGNLLDRLPRDVADRVLVTGWLARDEMRSALAAADIVTTPSIYLDNFPTTNLEAMAAGKPVVGTCFGGTPDVVEDGVTGIILNPLETRTFADALTALLKNPDLAKRMGEAGRKRLNERFSLEKQVSEHLELYVR